MAKKKRVSIVERLEETASDVANALSVAATGSELGILELAAEDELGRRPAQKRPAKPARKKTKTKTKTKKKPKTKTKQTAKKKQKVAAKKKVVAPRKPTKRKPAAKRRTR